MSAGRWGPEDWGNDGVKNVQKSLEDFENFLKRSGCGAKECIKSLAAQKRGFARLAPESEEELLQIAEECRPEIITLPNGLTLFITDNKPYPKRFDLDFISRDLCFFLPRFWVDRTKKSGFMLCVKSGELDCEIGGLAHLTEHLICSKRLEDNLKKISIDSNGITQDFETIYPDSNPVRVNRTDLKQITEIYFDEFSNINYGAMEWEIKRMKVERLSRMESPFFDAIRLFDRRMGWVTYDEKEVDSISESMVRRFVKEHYVPANMILMTKSNPELFKFAELLPKSVVKKSENRFAPHFPREHGRILVRKRMSHLYVSMVSFWFGAPSLVKTEERTLIDLGVPILRERISNTRKTDIITHYMDAMYSADRLFGTIKVKIGQIYPSDIGLAINLIEREIERIKREITDEEFERIKMKRIRELKRALDRGDQFGYFNELLYGYDDVVTTIRTLFSATKERVMATMSKYLDLNDCMVVIVEPGTEKE